MDTSIFATQTTGTSAILGNGQALQGKTGVFAGGPGMNFMDIIFAMMLSQGEMPQTSPADAETTSTLQASTPDYSGLDLLPEDMMALPAAGLLPVQAANSNLPIDTTAISPETRQKLLAFLQSLMQALPQEDRISLESIQKTLLRTPDTLTTENIEGGTDPALIVSGLTPEELAAIIRKLTEGAGDASAEAGISPAVQITPAEPKKESVFQPRISLQPAGIQPGKADGTSATTPEQATATPLTNEDEADTGFEKVLNMFETAKYKTNEAAAGKNTTGKPAVANAVNSAVMAASDDKGAMLTPTSWEHIYPEGISRPGGAGVTGPASLTSLVGQAQQASVPHPAVQQIVSAMVVRAADGESREMTLRLDPPELGRIAVKMEFSKQDKAVKAVLMAERPETFLMLQRDAHILQRSLQDAGIDTGSSGLSFQLAQDGNLAGQNNDGQGGGQAYSHGTGLAQDDADTVIETTMNWSVDPGTGVMHYDILA